MEKILTTLYYHQPNQNGYDLANRKSLLSKCEDAVTQPLKKT